MFVYMLKDSTNKIYVGISKNPSQRLSEHASKRGAVLTKKFINPEIVFLEEHNSYEDAAKREIQIKKWRREKKELLIRKYQKGLETKI